MPILPTPKGADKTGPMAECVCDQCGLSEKVRADYERVHMTFKVNEGQVLHKLTQKGWSFIKKVLRCPACEALRKQKTDTPKPQPEVQVTKIETPIAIAANTELRQPTREQKRLIVTFLEEAYDTEAQRYRGTSTDKTVAEEIGEGIMFGWVAQIREDLFGPDNGNEELEALKSDIQVLGAKIDEMVQKFNEHDAQVKLYRSELATFRTEQADLNRRLDAMKTAIGPKARAA